MPLEVGDVFHVTSAVDIKDRVGRTMTRFLPGHGYSVTHRNFDTINKIIDEDLKKVVKGNPPGLRSEPAVASTFSNRRARGRVTVGKKED